MSQSDIPELDRAGLRRFGLILGGILAAGFGVLLPWLKHWRPFPNFVCIAVGVIVLAWALLAPDSLRRPYRGWMRLSMGIGRVVNAVILSIVFYGVITPIGMVMRWRGRDPMRRRLDKNVASYREVSKVPARDHVERPF